MLDKSTQTPNPSPTSKDGGWIEEATWDNVTEMCSVLPVFLGMDASFSQYARDWKEWYSSTAPEEKELPGEWENKCSDFQRLIILRCLRPDRVIYSITSWVSDDSPL